MSSPDPRIPVLVGGPQQLLPGDQLLSAGAAGPALAHVPGCTCCAPRTRLAQGLAALWLAGVRGGAAPPNRVLVQGESPQAVAACLEGDVLARARFRFAGFA